MNDGENSKIYLECSSELIEGADLEISEHISEMGEVEESQNTKEVVWCVHPKCFTPCVYPFLNLSLEHNACC